MPLIYLDIWSPTEGLIFAGIPFWIPKEEIEPQSKSLSLLKTEVYDLVTCYAYSPLPTDVSILINQKMANPIQIFIRKYLEQIFGERNAH